MEEEIEFQVKGNCTKYNNIMEMAWNWKLVVLDSSLTICFCENIKN